MNTNRLFRFYLLPLLLLGGGIFFLFHDVIPRIAERRIPRLLHESCKACQLDLGRLKFTYVPFGFILESPKLVHGNKRDTEIRVRAGRVIANLSIKGAIIGDLRFQRVTVERPEVTVTEGDEARKPSGKTDSAERYYGIEKTDFTKGSFTYVRIHESKSATLKIQDLQGEIGAWGTSPEESTLDTHASVRGVLENSGPFTLDVSSPLFLSPLQVDLHLVINQLDLSRLNSFFEVNDGIRFLGTLVKGVNTTRIRGNALTSTVQVDYYDLGIDFKKNQDRGPFRAFLENLVKSVKLKSTHPTAQVGEPVKTQHLVRESSETLLQFIFRGMKMGALAVIM